jgi:hypothetical protein
VIYLHVSCIIYMYHELFACTMYDSHALVLCTVYDSHDIYLRVLLTIYMYKFSRCDIVVFTVFRSIYRFSAKITWFLAKFIRKSSRRLSGKNG